MSQFSKALLQLRQRLGFKTAKAFHVDLCRKGLECNYPHYKKLENAEIHPTPRIVKQIALGLGPDDQKALVLAHCRDQYPNFEFLFAISDGSTSAQMDHVKPKALAPEGQKTLTHRQVHGIGRSKEHYLVFVLFTMARGQLARVDLLSILSLANAEKVLDEFCELGLIYETARDSGFYKTVATEVKFPEADDQALQNLYRQFDIWDVELSDVFKFETALKKMLLRRISGRHLGLLVRQFELAMDMLKSSDDHNPVHNNIVIHLQLQLKKGTLPG